MTVPNRIFVTIMKIVCFLAIFFLANHAFSQEDTLNGPNLVEKLFNAADNVVDLVSGKSWIFIPALTYSPETSLGLGVRALKVFQVQEDTLLRPSTLPITLLYTLNQQVILTTAIDLWLKGNKDHLYGRIALMDYPNRFYGIGNEIIGKEEHYASRNAHLELIYQKQLAAGLFIGPKYVFSFDELYKKEPGGMLDSHDMPGSNGQRSSGLGFLIQYDIRVNIFQPAEGSFNQFSYMGFHRFLGSRYGFNQYQLDLRKYVQIHPAHIVAGQAWLSISSGQIPFQQLSMLGGSDRMRGYFEGKFRDRMAMVYQGEYRMPVYRNLGIVLFGSMGQVGRELSDFSLKGFRYGGGLGFRYKLREEGLNFRFDIAFGDQPAFYFGLNEVF